MKPGQAFPLQAKNSAGGPHINVDLAENEPVSPFLKGNLPVPDQLLNVGRREVQITPDLGGVEDSVWHKNGIVQQDVAAGAYRCWAAGAAKT